MATTLARSLVLGGVIATMWGASSERELVRIVGNEESGRVFGGCTWVDNENCPNYGSTGCTTQVCTGTSPQGPTCTLASRPMNTADTTWENACTTGYSTGLTDCTPNIPVKPQCGVDEICNQGPFCVARFGLHWCTVSHTGSSGYTEDSASGDLCYSGE